MPENSEGRLYYTDELPPIEVCRTAFAFTFLGDKMLFTRLVKRGWDIPGGHIEPGESPAQAAVRETIEEAQVIVEPTALIGIQELEVFGALPRAGWKKPALTAQIFYLCRVVEILLFTPTEEAVERAFFAPAEVRPFPTLTNHAALYELALKRAAA